MPRTVKEVLLYSSWLTAYMCEKSACVHDISTQMYQEGAETVLSMDTSRPHLVSSARTADTQSHGSSITDMGIVAL